jgi:hypothetical protein
LERLGDALQDDGCLGLTIYDGPIDGTTERAMSRPRRLPRRRAGLPVPLSAYPAQKKRTRVLRVDRSLWLEEKAPEGLCLVGQEVGAGAPESGFASSRRGLLSGARKAHPPARLGSDGGGGWEEGLYERRSGSCRRRRGAPPRPRRCTADRSIGSDRRPKAEAALRGRGLGKPRSRVRSIGGGRLGPGPGVRGRVRSVARRAPLSSGGRPSARRSEAGGGVVVGGGASAVDAWDSSESSRSGEEGEATAAAAATASGTRRRPAALLQRRRRARRGAAAGGGEREQGAAGVWSRIFLAVRLLRS